MTIILPRPDKEEIMNELDRLVCRQINCNGRGFDENHCGVCALCADLADALVTRYKELTR